jgi:DNA polymerase III sliding clamp (beta) subunit (PCNA family)
VIRLNRAALIRGLEALAPVVGGVGGETRFGNVLADANTAAPDLRLTAISADYSLVGERFVDMDGFDGIPVFRAMIPHAWLLDTARESPGDTLTLDTNGGKVTASAGRARFTHGTHADEFLMPEPVANEVERCEFTGEELAAALGEVFYALPRKEDWSTRPALAAVLIEDDGTDLRFVATSGRQFAMTREVRDVGTDAPQADPWRLSIPPGAVPVLRRFFAPSERVRLLSGAQNGSNYAMFAGEWGSLRVRLPEPEYPAYRSIVDQPEVASVSAARADLVAACSRAMIGNTGAEIRLHWRDGELHAQDDAGGYTDALAAECDGEFRFRGLAAQLKAALERTTGERVRLAFRGLAVLYVIGDGTSLHGTARMLNEDEKWQPHMGRTDPPTT